jgi:chromosome segregation ATPase
MGGSRYQFLGKLPLHKSHRWHLGIAAAGVIAILISFGISSDHNTTAAYARSAGSTYSSNDKTLTSPSPELPDLQSRIDSGRSRIEALKSQLQPVIDEMNNLDARMEHLAADLKTSKEQHDAGIKIDINDFNAKVRSYNALVRKRRALFDANSSDLQTYNDLRKQDSVLVDRYNALLK